MCAAIDAGVDGRLPDIADDGIGLEEEQLPFGFRIRA
jgi:hypothetical protein